MSQAGYTPIQLYYSTTAAAVPVNTNLANGELAINITDGKLYYKDNVGTVRLLASNATSAPVLSFSAGTTGFTPSTATSGAITLAGTLATTNGGTGLTSFTANQVFYASSTSAFAQSANLTFNGTTLTANTIGAFTLSGTIAGGGNQINNVIIGTTTPLAGAFTTLSATGVATFSAGTAALPALTTTGDTNTGIFFPAADTVATSVGGSERMRIQSDGKVGIETTSPYATLQIGSGFGGGNVPLTTKLMFGANNSIVTFLSDSASTSVDGEIGSWNTVYNFQNAKIDFYKSSANTGQIRFFTQPGTGITERFRISDQGAFGLSGANYGTSGQVLTSGGSGAAPTWTTVSGGGSPGGSNTQVQFNNSGSFGGAAGLTWNGTTLSATAMSTTTLYATSIQVAFSNTWSDNSTHGSFDDHYGKFGILTLAGTQTTNLPFITNGGSGISYQILVLNPATGQFSGGFSFTQGGTAGQTFSISGGGPYPGISYTRTSGSGSYTATTQLFKIA